MWEVTGLQSILLVPTISRRCVRMTKEDVLKKETSVVLNCTSVSIRCNMRWRAKKTTKKPHIGSVSCVCRLLSLCVWWWGPSECELKTVSEASRFRVCCRVCSSCARRLRSCSALYFLGGGGEKLSMKWVWNAMFVFEVILLLLLLPQQQTNHLVWMFLHPWEVNSETSHNYTGCFLTLESPLTSDPF